jgi:hypothetical protein
MTLPPVPLIAPPEAEIKSPPAPPADAGLSMVLDGLHAIMESKAMAKKIA